MTTQHMKFATIYSASNAGESMPMNERVDRSGWVQRAAQQLVDGQPARGGVIYLNTMGGDGRIEVFASERAVLDRLPSAIMGLTRGEVRQNAQ